jgi:hypothetical protein
MNDIDAISSTLADARPWFEEWRSPLEFERRYREVRQRIDSNFQFNRGEAKWLLEVWLISKFGRLHEFSKIRLNRADPPDAFVISASSTTPIEMTEVIEPGRQRGLEYQPGGPNLVEDPVEDWVSRAEKIPPALQKGIKKKQQKQYTSDTELLVYLNINELGIRQREIELAIKSTLSKSTRPFSKIHVLWKEKLFDSTGRTIRDPNALVDEDMGDDDEIFRSVWL